MLLRVVRTVIKKMWLVILFPVVMALTVFMLTRHQQRIYDCKMTIYTGISASSVGIDDDAKLDFFTANNAMDNLIAIFKARNTIEDASLRLIATHVSLTKPDSTIINSTSFKALKETLTVPVIKKVQVVNNPDATLANVQQFMQAYPNSVFQALLESDPHYSPDLILEKIKAVRRASSDMIDISYESDDAGICRQTLALLANAYFKRYSDMKRKQNASAVEYFERQLKLAFQKLQDSENRLKDFITRNKILNYYEQGKSLAIYEKEEEQEQQDVRQAAKAADAILKKLEDKLSLNRMRTVTVDSLTGLREEANTIRFRIQSMLLDQERYKTELASARSELQKVYAQISGKVAMLYMEDYSIEGIPSSQVLSEWLKQYMEKEKQLTYLEQVTASKNMVTGRIQEFAPLGAGLKRLEREVSVNESQYISILHGLNMANLQRQSLEEASAQQLIDEPFLPITPRASKRIMLVVASAFLGLVLVLAAIVAKIAFDNTLQNAAIASAKTGLKVLASFPGWHLVNRSEKVSATADIVVNQLVNELLVATAAKGSVTKHICIYQSLSIDDAELLMPLLQKVLRQLNYSCNAFAGEKHTLSGIQIFSEVPGVVANFTWNYFKELSPDNVTGFIIVCLPALKNQPMPVKLIAEADFVITCANAGRNWKPVDIQLLDMVERARNEKPAMVLNYVNTDNLKDYFGQIPLRNLLGRNRKKYS